MKTTLKAALAALVLASAGHADTDIDPVFDDVKNWTCHERPDGGGSLVMTLTDRMFSGTNIGAGQVMLANGITYYGPVTIEQHRRIWGVMTDKFSDFLNDARDLIITGSREEVIEQMARMQAEVIQVQMLPNGMAGWYDFTGAGLDGVRAPEFVAFCRME
ncbi:MAG: hypothetical protein GDA52_07325 [Rhodobacteraceae bacterium]|nr:hypothetical protein [Paracoccaceae bacterium]